MGEPSADAPVIVDVGTGLTKAGFGGEARPREVFPTVAGRPKSGQRLMHGVGGADRYVGEEAYRKQTVLQLSQPVQKGLPVLDEHHHQDFEDILRHAFVLSGACATGADDALRRPVLLTEPPQCTKALREEVGEVLFETFHAPAVWCGLAPALALYASGRTTGIVLDVGEGKTSAVPFLEGHAVPRSRWHSSEVAGFVQNDWLRRLVMERDRTPDGLLQLGSIAQMREFGCIKERLCYVAEDFDDELHQARTNPDSLCKVYELPDGGEVQLCDERFRVGELLFDPQLMWGAGRPGHETPRPIHQVLLHSVLRCDVALQPKLLDNVVGCGGVTLMRGFMQRLQKELNLWFNQTETGQDARRRIGLSKPVKVPARRQDDAVCVEAWRGGSILSELPSFSKLYVKEADYLENGKRMYLHNECAPALHS